MDQTDDAVKDSPERKAKRRSVFNKKVAIYAAGIAFVAALLGGGAYGYSYLSTPEHIRKPAFQHYHFRTQILVDGQAVDFSKDEFQKEKAAAIACSVAVGGTPIDFHDKMDQMTHVHWAGMTGGEFMKYFGWNFIGGSADSLGWRYDAGLMPSQVKIHSKSLPSLPDNTQYYVYLGDKNGYQQKNWNDFLNQDLETFFGKKSNVGHEEGVSFNLMDWLFPKVYAHGGVIDEHASDKSEEELTRINNLIGNVVVFAQAKEPTQEQITERFADLVPLSESTCGD